MRGQYLICRKPVKNAAVAYTRSGKESDRIVGKDLDTVKEQLVRNYPMIKSIYLLGSFARGEGTVIKSGREYVINDYDFLVVFGPEKPAGLEEFARNIVENVSASLVDISGTVEGEVKRRFEQKHQANYDLRMSRRLLYGDDTLEVLEGFPPEGITKWAAIKLLLNRVRTIIEYSPVDELNCLYQMEDKKKLVMSYNLFKTYISCMEAILIIEGQYKSTTEETYYTFRDDYSRKHASLIPDFERFLDYAKLSVSQKLVPDTLVYLKYANRSFLERTTSYLLSFFCTCINFINECASHTEDNVCVLNSPFSFVQSLRMNLRNPALKPKRFIPLLMLRQPAAYYYYNSMLNFLTFVKDEYKYGSCLTKSIKLLNKVYQIKSESLKDLRQAYINMAYSHNFALPIPSSRI